MIKYYNVERISKILQLNQHKNFVIPTYTSTHTYYIIIHLKLYTRKRYYALELIVILLVKLV